MKIKSDFLLIQFYSGFDRMMTKYKGFQKICETLFYLKEKQFL